MELQRSLPQFEAAGVYVAAVSYDPVGALAQFCDEHGITYDFFSDEGSNFIRELGILNTLVRPDEPIYGIPYPGAYVLDRDGNVMAKFFHREYQLREAASFILDEGFGLRPNLEGFPSASARAEGLRVTARLGAPDLKFRQRVNLYVLVEPDEEALATPPSVRVTTPADVRIGEVRYRAPAPDAHAAPGALEARVALDSAERERPTVSFEIEVTAGARAAVRLPFEAPVGELNRARRAS